MAEKRAQFNWQIGYSTDDVTYTLLTDVIVTQIPEEMIERMDISHQESPNQKREYGASWGDTGILAGEIYFTESQYAALRTLMNNRTEVYWKIYPPLATGQTNRPSAKMRGFMTKIGEIRADAKTTDAATFAFELSRSTGDITYTPGS